MTHPEAGPGPDQKIALFVSFVEKRLELRRGYESVCRGLFIGSLLALGYLLVARLADLPRMPWSFLAAALPPAAAIFAAGRSSRTRPTPYEAAKQADERLGLNDQLCAAYDFITAGRKETLANMVVRQVSATIDQPGVLERAVPFQLPGAFWAFFFAGLMAMTAHRGLYPPPLKPELSEATRRELEEGKKESLEGLLALESDLTGEEQKKEFERIRKLIEELNLMSEDATKEEILARLSREIAELDTKAGKDDAMSRALEELKKYHERVALGDLMDEVQRELDKGAEELAVVDASGQKVSAEAIQTLSLVDRQAMAEKRAKQEALATELKGVAKSQREKEEASTKEWALSQKKEKAEGGNRKEIKTGPLTYDALREAIENRDIRAMILDAASDKTRSSASYQEVYHNYQRIMESVLYQQRVPSGQEMYARRYFKVIRPKEAETRH